MSALTSSDARIWSAVSSYGNEASISPCHGRVGAEGVALRPGSRRVQLEQLLGEIGDRPRDPLFGT